MPLEAALWVLISVATPAGAAWAWPRLGGTWRARAEALRPLAPWAHAILAPYLALLRGAVLGRDFGLYGPSAATMAAGVLACAAGIGAALVARRWIPAPAISPLVALREEPRWALYRAAGILWLGSAGPGATLGLGLAAVEVGLAYRWWKAEERARQASWYPLLRAGLSTALFLATRSVWLTAATQIACSAIWPQVPERKSETGGA
jgi:hypothetical protein